MNYLKPLLSSLYLLICNNKKKKKKQTKPPVVQKKIYIYICVCARARVHVQEQVAIIVGSSTSRLATAACQSQLSIPYIILEREDYIASLWKKYSYDCLHLHLGKQFCELPHMFFPSSYLSYMPKKLFIQYLDDYVSVWQRLFLPAYFCYYSWVSLHFLVLFMSLTILFLLTFTFIYCTFNKKFSISAK